MYRGTIILNTIKINTPDQSQGTTQNRKIRETNQVRVPSIKMPLHHDATIALIP
jgi:hypothetical protein